MTIDTWALSHDELDEFDERAAVYQFDGGMTQSEAELRALADMQMERGE